MLGMSVTLLKASSCNSSDDVLDREHSSPGKADKAVWKANLQVSRTRSVGFHSPYDCTTMVCLERPQLRAVVRVCTARLKLEQF